MSSGTQLSSSSVPLRNGSDGHSTTVSQVSQLAPEAPLPPGMIRLSTVIEFALQKVYTDLIRLAEILPSKTDMERKMELAVFLNRTRHIFVRVMALVKFAQQGTMFEKCQKIIEFVEEQCFYMRSTADSLYFMLKNALVAAKLPYISIPRAIDILTLNTYPRLPSCIKDKIVPRSPPSRPVKTETLRRLDRLNRLRVSATEVPEQMKEIVFGGGIVTITVPDEFSIELTQMCDKLSEPWRILKLNLLVRDQELPESVSPMNALQKGFLHERVQQRILRKDSDSRRPLVHIYDMLHSICLSLQLEILQQQTHRIYTLRLGKCIGLEQYVVGSHLAISYWRPLSKLFPGQTNQVYTLSVMVDKTNSRSTLVVRHNPDLPIVEQREICNGSIRGRRLSMSELLTKTMAVRSHKMLKDLRVELACLTEGTVRLTEFPTALLFPLLHPSRDDEMLRIRIDPQQGLFLVSMETKQRCPALNAIQETLNSTFKTKNAKRERLLTLFGEVREWVALRRVERTVQSFHLPTETSLSIPVLPPGGDAGLELLKRPMDRVYIRLLPRSQHYLVVQVTCRGLTVHYTHELLICVPCDSQGKETPNGPFLRETSHRKIAFEEDHLTKTWTSGKRLTHPETSTVDAKNHRFERMMATLRGAQKADGETPLDKPEGPDSRSESSDCPAKRPRLELAESVENIGILWQLQPVMTRVIVQVYAASLISALTTQELEYDQPEVGLGKDPHEYTIKRFPATTSKQREGTEALYKDMLSCTVTMETRSSSDREMIGRWLFRRPGKTGKRLVVDVKQPITCLADVELGLTKIVQKWRDMSRLRQACVAFLDNGENLRNEMVVKDYNFENFVLAYGLNLRYLASVTFSSSAGFRLHLSQELSKGVSQEMFNPHELVHEHLEQMLRNDTPLLQVAKEMVYVKDFVTALCYLQSNKAVNVFSKDNNKDSNLVRNMVLKSTSIHRIQVVYRASLTLEMYLAGQQAVQLSEVVGGQRSSKLPLFQKFLDSLQEAFQMDIEEDVWAGPTVSQLTQLTRPKPHEYAGPLEAYFGACYLFQAAQGQLQPLGDDRLLVRTTDYPIGQMALALVSVRTGIQVPVWRLRLEVGLGMLAHEEARMLERYFEERVSCYPYNHYALTSFLQLAALPKHILQDLIRVMQWELEPSTAPTVPSRPHTSTIRLSLTSPLSQQPAIRVQEDESILLQLVVAKRLSGDVTQEYPIGVSYSARSNTLTFSPLDGQIETVLGHRYKSMVNSIRNSGAERHANSQSTANKAVSPVVLYLTYLITQSLV